MNDIRIVPIDQDRSESNALYHCDACTHAYPTQWPRWRIEAGINHGGNTRTMRLCDAHRIELLDLLASHDEDLAQKTGRHQIIT